MGVKTLHNTIQMSPFGKNQAFTFNYMT